MSEMYKLSLNHYPSYIMMGISLPLLLSLPSPGLSKGISSFARATNDFSYERGI